MVTAWTDRLGDVRLAFLGRSGDETERPAPSLASGALSALERARTIFGEGSAAPELVHCRQVHSATVVDALQAGTEPPQADGLSTDRPGVALCIFTADCVPVLLASSAEERLLALHAGWRGLGSGILGRGVAMLERPARATAWIGPCIGSCCYEVSEDVALQVARRSGMSCVVRSGGPRPHLDLVRAARGQLAAAGVEDVRILRTCTRCDADWHSYRREGAGQGRNHALVWRDGEPEET